MIRVRFFDGGDRFNIMCVDELRYDETAYENEPAIMLSLNGNINGYIPVDSTIISTSQLDEIFDQALEKGFIDFCQSGFGSYIWSDDDEVEE